MVIGKEMEQVCLGARDPDYCFGLTFFRGMVSQTLASLLFPPCH